MHVPPSPILRAPRTVQRRVSNQPLGRFLSFLYAFGQRLSSSSNMEDVGKYGLAETVDLDTLH